MSSSAGYHASSWFEEHGGAREQVHQAGRRHIGRQPGAGSVWFQFDPGRLVARFVVLGPLVRGGGALVNRFGVRVLGPEFFAGRVAGSVVTVRIVAGGIVAGGIRVGRIFGGLRCGAGG